MTTLVAVRTKQHHIVLLVHQVRSLAHSYDVMDLKGFFREECTAVRTETFLIPIQLSLIANHEALIAV